MGLLLHHTSSHHTDANGATIEMIADLDLYNQYSRELNILHQVNMEPSTACLTELLKRIKAVAEEQQGSPKP